MKKILKTSLILLLISFCFAGCATEKEKVSTELSAEADTSFSEESIISSELNKSVFTKNNNVIESTKLSDDIESSENSKSSENTETSKKEESAKSSTNENHSNSSEDSKIEDIYLSKPLSGEYLEPIDPEYIIITPTPSPVDPGQIIIVPEPPKEDVIIAPTPSPDDPGQIIVVPEPPYKKPVITPTPTPEDPDYELYFQSGSVLKTSISLVDNIATNNNKDNVVISGLSINYALSMLLNGTNEVSSDELESFLGMNKNEANKYYSELTNILMNKEDNKVLIANSFWINRSCKYPVKKSYIDTLKSKYNADVNNISMDNNGANIINDWVDKSTDGLIKKVVDGDKLKGADSVIINAITFEGDWLTPFSTSNVSKETFHDFNNNKNKIEMMNSEEYYYYENEFATAFRKDYKNSELYFVGILPKKEGDFTLTSLDIEGLLKTGKHTSDINADLHIKLPKLDLEDNYDLTNVLKAAGVKQVFDQNKNNLSEMYDTNDKEFYSYVDSINQNVVLKVDENGTKAAAATTVIGTVGSAGPGMEKQHLEVYLNRPFVVLIMDSETNEPLFIAKVTNLK